MRCVVAQVLSRLYKIEFTDAAGRATKEAMEVQGEKLWMLVRRLQRAAYGVRAQVRGSELALVILAVGVGAVAGLVVAAMGAVTGWMHTTLFGMRVDTRIADPLHATLLSWAFIPVIGGVLMGATLWLQARWRSRPVVDPVEANALHGGQMSLRDSLILTFQTLLSNGFGASVGLEAGYTQMGSALASKLGLNFRLRREDLRVLVAAGAGGAIAAAFGAPLTGAFYGFELILGAYSIAAAAPVLAAAVTATLVMRMLGGVEVPVFLPASAPTVGADYMVFIVMGLVCGLVGIAIMHSVAWVEQGFRAARIPPWARPALGGVVVGGLALVTPQVLWEGHAAMRADILQDLALGVLLAVFVLKAAASIVSLGAGFRGGLFFASLFLGSLMGKMVTAVAGLLGVEALADPVTSAVVGMSAMAVAIIGGPLTMTFMALETTGDFVITGIVLAAAVVASMTVRELFGYSFTTWRLHLRGETIRSAQDIGWIRNLTVGRLMQGKVVTAPVGMTLAQFRRQFPLGGVERVVMVEDEDRYAGMVFLNDVYGPAREITDGELEMFVKHRNVMLTPAMNVKAALEAFDRNETDALVVVEDVQMRRVLGIVTEGYALKRYAAELDKARRSLAGEKG